MNDLKVSPKIKHLYNDGEIKTLYRCFKDLQVKFPKIKFFTITLDEDYGIDYNVVDNEILLQVEY